jgi:CRISPR-associated endonuclease Cas2
MARPRLLYIFTYDIERDRTRARTAALLEKHLVRVQKSVFEGRLTSLKADRLRNQIMQGLGPADSLRVYAVSQDMLAACSAHGAVPLAENGHYLLF